MSLSPSGKLYYESELQSYKIIYIKMRVCSVLTLLVLWNWLVLFVSSENVSLPPSSYPQRLPDDLYENYIEESSGGGGGGGG